MRNEIALSAEDRALVGDILAREAPGIEVWAYGSRVNGTSSEASDLDLVLRGVNLRPVSVSIVSRLIDAFDESSLPIIVDVHDWARMPKAYHEEIGHSYYILVPAR
ncbi:MAG: nucleotidyltransferase domain-containing protein [Chloroflexota bacterium]|nr:nucleotidyltransferase domain-containing protein [Chloroflexota bacterium]